MQILLKLLGDGRFHSGEELGAALGISRSAVWKRLQGLESEFGLEVQSVRGRGYRLAEPLVAIDPQRVRAPWPLDVLFSVDSTNAEVMRRLDAGAATPFAVVAERQTAGRGRRGRAWVSPFGANLYCTLGISVRGGPKELEGLSLVVGLAVVRAIQSLGIAGVGLKWPNDILLDGKKLAGILLELTGDPADLCSVAIGIGINGGFQLGVLFCTGQVLFRAVYHSHPAEEPVCRNPFFPYDLAQPAGSHMCLEFHLP